MRAEIKAKCIRIFLIIVLTTLFCNSVFFFAITGDLVALIRVVFHIVIAILLFNNSKYLYIGLMVWGTMIIMTGLYKIVLQILVSFDGLITDPVHLIKIGLVLLGYAIFRIGSQELNLIMEADSES